MTAISTTADEAHESGDDEEGSEAPDRWAATARKMDSFSSPLRPHPDDTAIVEATARSLAQGRDGLSVVVLGVTEETVGCHWPAGTRLRAFDASPETIRTLWRPDLAPAGATAERADWAALPVATGDADLVTADGCLNIIAWPGEVRQVLAEVRRMLRPGGRFLVRSTLRPPQPEALETILEDLEAGRIAGAYALKVRIGTTLHDDGIGGFSMHDMWKMWLRLFPDQETVPARFGWPVGAFTFGTDYADQDIRLVYPTFDELLATVEPWFRLASVEHGRYELADRCPTLLLEPK
jgi:SAM-dependent methyltransferase